MKKIINGKRYDTDKATLIGGASSGGSVTDFRYWSAGLYVTPVSGRHFLAGHGGAMTRWAKSVSGGNTTCGSEGIVPLDEAEALEWAEANLSPDEIEQHFGYMIEDA